MSNGRRILIADDEEDIKFVVKFHLESQGYEVITAFDGLDTLALAESEKPDLILLDVMMPVMNGFEVARKLRDNPLTMDIPVVMLSAAAKGESIKQALESGARDYLVKPFEPQKLDEVIQRILK